MDSLVKEWALFLDRCLEHRIQADKFDAAATQLHTKSPLPGPKLAALLLKPRSAVTKSVDPRVIIYAERLLVLKKVDTSDVLSAAFQHSRDRPGAGDGNNPKDPSRWQNPPELEEVMFYRLQKAYSGPERPATNTEGYRTLSIVTRWMSAMVISHTSDSMMQAINGTERQPQDQQQSMNIREALGVLVSGLIDNGKILQLLNRDELKGGCLFPVGYESCIKTSYLGLQEDAHLKYRRSNGIRQGAVNLHSVSIADFHPACQPTGDLPERA
jgi:mediator of RNA polymerase II transcription subunit 5